MDIKTLYNLFLASGKVTTDSRNISNHSIFFALKGNLFNGNSFAEEALYKGASYAVIDEKKYQTDPRMILVNDVLKALQELAKYHRKKLNIPILSLTGSNGKTTTKELTHAVLSKKYKTVATQGNLNNHIGVPLTLLSMDNTTEFGIVEMGANHQGEIAFLCSIATPDYGFITNFGKAHLEGFGGVAGVIKGKSELYNHLIQHHKFIFYNVEDDIQAKKLKHYDQKYGYSEYQHRGNLHIQREIENPFTSSVRFKNNTIASKLIGTYNFNNIAMAITIGTYFNIPAAAIKDAVETYTPVNNRSQLIKTSTCTIILDAYNANPTSMKAAIDNFAAFPHKNKTAFLGDMFELGEEAVKEHQYIADYAKKKGLDEVYLVGQYFYDTSTRYKTFDTYAHFEAFIKKQPMKDRIILIKGSRGMALERILNIL